MALIAEDGTGLETANALIDVTFADSYFDLRNNTTWAGLTLAEKEAKIILATDYMERRYYGLVIGNKKNQDQALLFPLSGSDSVPEKVKKACAEYALIADQLNLSFQTDSSGREVVSKTIKAGSVTTSKEFARGKSNTFKKFPTADSYMIPFISSGNELIR